MKGCEHVPLIYHDAPRAVGLGPERPAGSARRRQRDACSAPPAGDHGNPIISIMMVAPFGVLLASIAIMPLIAVASGTGTSPTFSFALGGLVAATYLAAFTHTGPGLSYGQERCCTR